MDLDQIFSKIEKKPQKQQVSKPQKSQISKEDQMLESKLKHELNRLDLVKLTAENLYQAIPHPTQQHQQFESELVDGQIIEMIGDQNLYEEKIRHKNFLLGKFEKPFQLKNNAEGEIQQPLKNSLNRQMKIFKRSLQNLTYSSVQRLHQLWKVYIEDLLGKEKQMESKFQRLLKADFHGAFIQIAYSKCKTYEGQEGIVVREKKKQFIIIKENNKLCVIEKKNAIFLLPVEKQIYRLHGCHLLIKPAERIRKDIKYHAANQFCYKYM